MPIEETLNEFRRVAKTLHDFADESTDGSAKRVGIGPSEASAAIFSARLARRVADFHRAAGELAVSALAELTQAAGDSLKAAERRLEEVREENRRERERAAEAEKERIARDKKTEIDRAARELEMQRIARRLNWLTVFGVLAATAAAAISALALLKKDPPIVMPSPINSIQLPPTPTPIVNPQFTVTVDGRPTKSILRTAKTQPETKGTEK